MSIDRRMDKEGVIHIYNGILLHYKKNKIMPLAETWMDIEMIILSEVSHRRTNMISVYVESKKLIQINFLIKQRHTDFENKIYGY